MRTWEINADDFGGLYRQDKDFRLAALVACSVERMTNQHGESDDSLKCSARAFAVRANVSQSTVSRYLRNWEAMATEGLVPNPESLTPDDVDSLEPTTATLERWEELPAIPVTQTEPIDIEPMALIDIAPYETMHALAQPVPFDRVLSNMVSMARMVTEIETTMPIINDPDEWAVFHHRIVELISRLNAMVNHATT